MTICVEVTCETSPGDEVVLCGEDAAIGAWDVSRGVRLQTTEELYPRWSCSLSVPSSSTEFKFVKISGGTQTWEALEANRRWPSAALHEGSALKMAFGEPKIGVELSPAKIEQEARKTKALAERSNSALQQNIDHKGDNAYYFAHNRHFEVPEDAKVITGPGLITGGAPTLLEIGTTKVDDEADRTQWLKDYSWSDHGTKVKVYVPVPDGALPAEGADDVVEATYTAANVDLMIKSKPFRRLKIDKLNAEIKPESCLTRVEAQKCRIVLHLSKKRETTWYSLTKK
mmetsp:Transcript_52080/g.124002  ORF Transcript_52080/g.124002 Transcript_52080/m.124002 type:complete len:285 (-) Transcript_52080:100-954(-)